MGEGFLLEKEINRAVSKGKSKKVNCFNHFFAFFFGRFVDCCYLCRPFCALELHLLLLSIMMKQYKTPSFRVVLLDENDLIVTSYGDDQKSLDVTDTNTDFSDKAPNRSIWGDD